MSESYEELEINLQYKELEYNKLVRALHLWFDIDIGFNGATGLEQLEACVKNKSALSSTAMTILDALNNHDERRKTLCSGERST